MEVDGSRAGELSAEQLQGRLLFIQKAEMQEAGHEVGVWKTVCNFASHMPKRIDLWKEKVSDHYPCDKVITFLPYVNFLVDRKYRMAKKTANVQICIDLCSVDTFSRRLHRLDPL